ncbi:DUF6525 family protein [Tabrizicola sp.]|uniref:DUF6525 family protein n=1 Tax=Tabrizicola sp. TaxID=2005166 RepID=UPI00273327A8|nr:DUF6525 family protein [Tabrizicola sp.]MDP3193974.1 DUF6525 family protein [Tabrizicola sp.]
MSNLTSPRVRWRATDPMSAYDRLPPDLRAWLAEAALPWSAASVLRLWQKALTESGCTRVARDRLARAEQKTLAREAARVWGQCYPADQTLAKRR